MLAALGQFACTLIVLLEIALGALFTMSGAVLVAVDRAPFVHDTMGRLGAALTAIGLGLFFLGSRGFAGLAL